MNTRERSVDMSPIIVHKEGEEGTLQIDRLTGQIKTDNDQRPDWSEGLAVALLGERNTFYQQRLGKDSEAFKAQALNTEAVEYRDLGWLGFNADQQEVEIEADMEYRSERVAQLLGIDTEAGTFGADVMAEREVDAQPGRRTPGQATALSEAIASGFAVAKEGQQANKRAQGGGSSV